MPATWPLSGTPASISARQPPHTEAIDDEPLDSVISETTRSVSPNSSLLGSTASSARLARRPWPELFKRLGHGDGSDELN